MSKLTTLESIFIDNGFIKDLTKIMLDIKDYANFIAQNEKSIETQFDMQMFSLSFNTKSFLLKKLAKK
ncbi:hypothetical protein MOMA_04425 [Moraxella macacae 0408225]|uniref:Uncharacterized protein n=1 Tax=Moraxella macacae 0408225 TaxID=1230338 RepID=L2FA52_9GAMM|nr:hypothetical protein [Moraxella macacae]ELA09621.1 hypothetical protein MOMA_04425 [Moraxella macacae 0408225]